MPWPESMLVRTIFYRYQFSSVQFSSVAQLCLTLCDPMNCSTPGLPVHHQLPEFTQTHVHRVCDAIQPSHPLSSPSPPAPNPSQHQGLLYRHVLICILKRQTNKQAKLRRTATSKLCDIYADVAEEN